MSDNLVIRLPNYVGDLVMSLPALELVRRHGIQARVLGPSYSIDLLSELPHELEAAGNRGAERRRYRQLGARFGLTFRSSLRCAVQMRWAGLKPIGYAMNGRAPFLWKRPPMPRGVLNVRYDVPPAILAPPGGLPYAALGRANPEIIVTAHALLRHSLSACLAVAVLAPLLGAVADLGGRRKPWLLVFTMLCIVAGGALWTVAPDPDMALRALVLVALANAAFELGQVFYNAMLPEVARPGMIGRLSGWAWGLGYAGGLICLVVFLVFFIWPETPPTVILPTSIADMTGFALAFA